MDGDEGLLSLPAAGFWPVGSTGSCRGGGDWVSGLAGVASRGAGMDSVREMYFGKEEEQQLMGTLGSCFSWYGGASPFLLLLSGLC